MNKISEDDTRSEYDDSTVWVSQNKWMSPKLYSSVSLLSVQQPITLNLEHASKICTRKFKEQILHLKDMDRITCTSGYNDNGFAFVMDLSSHTDSLDSFPSPFVVCVSLLKPWSSAAQPLFLWQYYMSWTNPSGLTMRIPTMQVVANGLYWEGCVGSLLLLW